MGALFQMSDSLFLQDVADLLGSQSAQSLILLIGLKKTFPNLQIVDSKIRINATDVNS